MPRLWQFPATAPTFTALPQPAAPGAGFEGVSPSVLPRAKAARSGNYVYVPNALPQPPAPGAGFEGVSPAILLKGQPAQSGNAFYPLVAQRPTSDANPLGWEPISPPKLRRALMPVGHEVLPEKRPPVANTQDGWEAFFPPKMIRGRMASTSEDHALNKPPAATANDPLGWEAFFPWKMRSKPVDRGQGGTEGPLMPPAAATVANPLGWSIMAPVMLPHRPADGGCHAFTLVSLPQPEATRGWEALAPVNLPKRPTDAGRSEFTLFKPPAATSARPLGWEAVAPALLPRSRAATWFAFAPQFLIPAATSAAPLGWEAVAPWRVRKATGVSGTADTAFQPPPIFSPYGWPSDAPALMRKRVAPQTFTFQPGNQPPTQSAGNPLGWEPVAPAILPRRVAPGVGTFQPQNLLPPVSSQFPQGWQPIAPFLLKKRPNDGTFQLQFGFGPLTPITLWYVFPASMPRASARPGASDLSHRAPSRPVEGWTVIAPTGSRRPPVAGFVVDAEIYRRMTPPRAWVEFPATNPRTSHAPVGDSWTIVPYIVRPVAWFECLYPRGARPVLPRGLVELVAVWVPVANPHVASRRLVFAPPSRIRYEFLGSVNRRLEIRAPIVKRLES